MTLQSKNILIMEKKSNKFDHLKKLGLYLLFIEEFIPSVVFPIILTSELEIQIEQKIRDLSIHKKISHVLCFNDKLQLFVSTLCSNLNIHYMLTIEQCELIYNKFKLRKLLTKYQIDNIESLELTSNYLEEIDSFLQKNDTIILKPKNGTASEKIYKLKPDTFLQEVSFYNKLLNRDYINFFIETYIKGKEFSIESFSFNGRHYIYGITEKFINKDFIEIAHIVNIDIKGYLKEKIISFMLEVLNTLQIKDGAMHSEIIVDDADNIHLVETQCRLGGDFIPFLYQISSSYSMNPNNICYELIVSDYRSEQIVKDISFSNTAGIFFITNNFQFLIEEIENCFYLNKSYKAPNYARLGFAIFCDEDYSIVKKQIISLTK